MGAAVFLSRILGLVRDQVFAKLFGAGLFNDAWLVAFRIPGLLRDLFAEGALSAALIPSFTEALRRHGRDSMWRLANLALSALLVGLGLLTLLLLLGAEGLVHGLAAGFAQVPGKVEVTASLIRVLSPFLLLVAAASVAMSILNTLNHYFVPALAPALFNVAVILSGLVLAPWFEAQGILPIYAMAVGAVGGGILQYLIQLPLLRREGYRFRLDFDWNHPALRKMVRLLGPALVGVSAVQVNVLVNTQLASFLQDNGPVSWLSYAFRLIYLPIGLFGVAVGVVNLRTVSSQAAEGHLDGIKETVANSIKLIAFLAIPSSVGLMVLAHPIVDVLFERGDFTSLDTRNTAYALVAYSFGLFAYSCNKVYVPTFYALDDSRTPVRVAAVSILANLTANLSLLLVLPTEFAYIGLAVGTSISAVLTNSVLVRRLRQRLGSFEQFGIRRAVLRNLAAALAMGFLVLLADGVFAGLWADPDLAREIIGVAACLAIGLVTYISLAAWLRVPEVGYLARIIGRRAT